MPKAKDPTRPPAAKKPSKGETAFDMWLKGRIKEFYGPVAEEPIPAEWLRLIEEDRNK